MQKPPNQQPATPGRKSKERKKQANLGNKKTKRTLRLLTAAHRLRLPLELLPRYIGFIPIAREY